MYHSPHLVLILPMRTRLMRFSCLQASMERSSLFLAVSTAPPFGFNMSVPLWLALNVLQRLCDDLADSGATITKPATKIADDTDAINPIRKILSPRLEQLEVSSLAPDKMWQRLEYA
jgi:hypothetical protein